MDKVLEVPKAVFKSLTTRMQLWVLLRIVILWVTRAFQRCVMLNASDGSEDYRIRFPGIDGYTLNVHDSDSDSDSDLDSDLTTTRL